LHPEIRTHAHHGTEKIKKKDEEQDIPTLYLITLKLIDTHSCCVLSDFFWPSSLSPAFFFPKRALAPLFLLLPRAWMTN
jgi:hypothetical protein